MIRGRGNVTLSRALALLLALCTVTVAACGDSPVPALRLQAVATGAALDAPVEVLPYPDGRLLVAERGGRLWLLDEDGAQTLLGDLAALLEAERGEGLLSVALDPAFEANGRLWAYYFAADEPWRTVLSRFEVRDGEIAPARETVVLEFPQPGFNQNGGAVRFDREGYLYLSLGDGSASTDPFEQGQDTTTLLATVIRLDVRESSSDAPYRVPSDNPFAGTPEVRPEIYAYGFRNPWRMAFDPLTGDLWLGDVGVSSAEELNRVEAGANYGWSILEGERCLDERDCRREGLVPPVHAYPHEDGRCAIVGGVVYRGDAVDELAGRVLFGDLCTGEVWALDPSRPEARTHLVTLDGTLVSFGIDHAGEVLLVDHAGGLYRLLPD